MWMAVIKVQLPSRESKALYLSPVTINTFCISPPPVWKHEAHLLIQAGKLHEALTPHAIES